MRASFSKVLRGGEKRAEAGRAARRGDAEEGGCDDAHASDDVHAGREAAPFAADGRCSIRRGASRRLPAFPRWWGEGELER